MKQRVFRLGATVLVSTFVFASATPRAGAVQEPDALPIPPDAAVVREVQGGGAQVYACRAKADGTFGWLLVGPKAVLVNDDGSDFGTHSAGPRWTAIDGSSITADGAHPLAKVDRANSVPALLLKVASTHGTGILSDVRFVRRADTKGGVAPLTGCDATHVDAGAAVHYSATYTFYR